MTPSLRVLRSRVAKASASSETQIKTISKVKKESQESGKLTAKPTKVNKKKIVKKNQTESKLGEKKKTVALKKEANSFSTYVGDDGNRRCWGAESPQFLYYHDHEWGCPSDNNFALFGQMTLQIFQTGLSWKTILNKKDAFEEAFDKWDYNIIYNYKAKDLERLLGNANIIRNERKIKAVINNAQVAVSLDAQEENGFVKFVWKNALTLLESERIVKGAFPSTHMRTDYQTKSSERVDADCVHPTVNVGTITKIYKNQGFKHIGETTILSFLQATGQVNHHRQDCFVFDSNEALFEQMKKKYS